MPSGIKKKQNLSRVTIYFYCLVDFDGIERSDEGDRNSRSAFHTLRFVF